MRTELQRTGRRRRGGAARGVAVLAAVVGLATSCGSDGDATTAVAGTADPADPPGGTTALLPGEGADPLVACGVPGEPFRLSVLDGPTGAEAADDAAAEALRAQIAASPSELPASGWRVLSSSDDLVSFVHGERPLLVVQTVERRDGRWRAAMGMAGDCQPWVYVEGAVDVEWNLDPATPLTPESTELHLLVAEPCRAAPPDAARVVGPEVRETDDAVLIGVALRRAADDGMGQSLECRAADGALALTVVLDAPLGDRVVLDGMAVPPAPPAGTLAAAGPATTVVSAPPIVLDGGTSELGVAVTQNRTEPCPSDWARCPPTEPFVARVRASSGSAAAEGDTATDGTVSVRAQPGPVTVEVVGGDRWCPTLTTEASATATIAVLVGCTRLDRPHGTVVLAGSGPPPPHDVVRFTRDDDPIRQVELRPDPDGTTEAVLEPGTWTFVVPGCDVTRSVVVEDGAATDLTLTCA